MPGVASTQVVVERWSIVRRFTVVVAVGICGLVVTSPPWTPSLSGQTATREPLVLTYVANMGVLTSLGPFQILIDGLFNKPHSAGRVRAPETLESMMKGEAPFDGVDLMYLIEVHGWRVFHEGDSSGRPDDFLGFGLETNADDLAIFSYAWPLSPHRRFLQRSSSRTTSPWATSTSGLKAMRPAGSAQVGGRWSSPEVLPVVGQLDALYPFLGPDGRTLVYCSPGPVEGRAARLPRGVDCRLWILERTGSVWAAPRILDSTVGADERAPAASVSSRGTIVYGRKDRRDPSSNMDLYWARFVGGRYERPVRLPDPVNSGTVDAAPFLAPDQSYLLFASFRPGSRGRSDLYVSFRLPNDTWTRPMNLGDDVNSSAKDEYPYVSPDGRFLFFNSNRASPLNKAPVPDGAGNVYWVSTEVITRLRPAAAGGPVGRLDDSTVRQARWPSGTCPDRQNGSPSGREW